MCTEVRQDTHKPDNLRSLWPNTGTAYLSREHKQQTLKKELTWNTSWPWGTWRLLAHNVFHETVVSQSTVVWRTS